VRISIVDGRACTFLLLVIAVNGFASTPSPAGGFYSPYQSSTAIGTAFAGASARFDDASFFFYNPAILSSLEGRQSFVDVRGFVPTARIKATQATSPAGTVITPMAKAALAESAIAPGSVSTLPLGNGLTLGLGSSAHFASDVEAPNETWAGRFHLLKSRIVGANATAALSWEATPWLAVAGGLQVQRLDTRFESAALIPIGPGAAIETRAYLRRLGSGRRAGPAQGVADDAHWGFLAIPPHSRC
jgi:long-chain fatty acid transport protein